MSASPAGRATTATIRAGSGTTARIPSTGLRAAAAASVVLVVLDIGIRLAVPPNVAPSVDASGGGPSIPLTPLLAIAALCVVGIGLRREASVAWLAAVAADSIVAADLVELGLLVRDPSGLTSTAPLAATLCVALTAAVATAAGYAASPARRLHRAVGWLGIVAVAWLVVASVMSVGAIVTETVPQARQSIVRVVTLPVRWWQYAALGFVGLGIMGDVVAADRRARRRAIARSGGATAEGRFADRLASRLDARVPPLLDELVPGRAAARDEATEAERARLAAELHADVVPAVRRALAAVEAGGSVERLAADLRDVLGEVEGLLAQRRSIVLEELGLVAGLEWLAERVEERGSSRVTLEVHDESSGRPPRAVERAAFRIAGLALDNVARHAPDAAVTVAVLASADRVALSIADDGPGIPEARPAEARAAGRRGLADMHAEAGAIGASLAFEPVEPHGTAVRLEWPARD